MGNTQQNQDKKDNKFPISQQKFVGLDNYNSNTNINSMKHLLRHLYKHNFVSLTYVHTINPRKISTHITSKYSGNTILSIKSNRSAEV
jgi:hypothetical protein